MNGYPTQRGEDARDVGGDPKGAVVAIRRPNHPGRSLLAVGAFPEGDSVERFPTAALVSRLQGRGWTVTITSRCRNRALRVLDIMNVVWRARAEYQIGLVDVFSGRGFVWAELAVTLLHKLGKKIVVMLHGGNLPEFAQKNASRVRRLLNLVSVVTAPSAYLQKRLSSYRDDIILIPNAMAIPDYTYRHRTELRPNMIWLRAFHRGYNPLMAIKVVNELTATYPHARLEMIGPDKGDGSFAEVKKHVREFGLNGNVIVREAIEKSDVPERLATDDIFLNTTNVDNTPVSVIEAMACGLCVVTTNPGGIPFLLSDGENALLVPCEDDAAMTNAIKRLLCDPELAGQLSKNGRKFSEQFDWSEILPKWEHLLSSVLARNDARALKRAPKRLGG